MTHADHNHKWQVATKICVVCPDCRLVTYLDRELARAYVLLLRELFSVQRAGPAGAEWRALADLLEDATR